MRCRTVIDQVSCDTTSIGVVTENATAIAFDTEDVTANGKEIAILVREIESVQK